MKITYALVVLNRLDEVQKAIRLVSPFVDKTCVIDGGSTDGSIEWLSGLECRALNVELRVSKQIRLKRGNHTPRERNQYLEMAGTDGWILVTDSDEFLQPEAVGGLRQLAEAAEEKGANVLGFRAHDVWTYEDGRVYDNLSSYWHHSMFFKASPGMQYAGHTHAGLVRPGVEYRRMDLPYEYQHTKTERRLWLNSTYLWWTTAAPAQNTTSPVWEEFHDLMGRHGYFDWHEFNKVMTVGEVPQEIQDWFVAHKDAENPEERSWFIWYHIFLHPDQNPNRLNNRDLPWDYIEQAKLVREGKLDKWVKHD